MSGQITWCPSEAVFAIKIKFSCRKVIQFQQNYYTFSTSFSETVHLYSGKVSYFGNGGNLKLGNNNVHFRKLSSISEKISVSEEFKNVPCRVHYLPLLLYNV